MEIVLVVDGCVDRVDINEKREVTMHMDMYTLPVLGTVTSRAHASCSDGATHAKVFRVCALQ